MTEKRVVVASVFLAVMVAFLFLGTHFLLYRPEIAGLQERVEELEEALDDASKALDDVSPSTIEWDDVEYYVTEMDAASLPAGLDIQLRDVHFVFLRVEDVFGIPPGGPVWIPFFFFEVGSGGELKEEIRVADPHRLLHQWEGLPSKEGNLALVADGSAGILVRPSEKPDWYHFFFLVRV